MFNVYVHVLQWAKYLTYLISFNPMINILLLAVYKLGHL